MPRIGWSLYPRTDRLPMKLFARPTAEYRGAPFWSWNARLDGKQFLRQIELLRQMGFGGFHIHARTGLATEYLGEKFMSLVRDCVSTAKKKRMLAWLYDEDRWPSGFAGGLVTRDPALRIRNLLWTTRPYQPAERPQPVLDRDAGGRAENGRWLASYQVELAGGRLKRYRRVGPGARPSARTWHAYLEIGRPSSWFNNQTYIDTMNPAAVERFIEVTHERYAAAVGDFFGSVVPAIFTDEPHFTKKQTLRRGGDTNDVILPFSEDFLQTYRRAFGADLLEALPELFWNLPGDAPSLARYRYHEHTAERFAAAFGDTIAGWCDRRGIALTGHMLSEATLFGQTRAVGEVMRGLRSFALPGIDMLEDKLEFTTAKQAQSVARQNGRCGVMSELYGVTNWDFDFAGHKRQGDWQAAMGVTVRVPHLAWVSMAGEAKRDYPAAIDYHSPWFGEYRLVEDHFARLNTVLTRGRPLVRVAVVHPIESFWLAFGPLEHNAARWSEMEQSFAEITRWLAHGLIDFDFVSEAALANARPGGRRGTFDVGAMGYDAVVAPNLLTIRSSTLKRLAAFARGGGKVIFAGEVPQLVDARPSAAAVKLAARATVIPFSRRRVLEALESFRDVDVRTADGALSDSVLHQLRQDGRQQHLFLCNTHRDRAAGRLNVGIRGSWRIERLDTLTGRRREIPATVHRGRTIVPLNLEAHDHALLSLTPGRPRKAATVPPPAWRDAGRLPEPHRIDLSEPNVLLLDQARWRINGGRWQGREEILRIDNLLRKHLGLPPRGGLIAQPWTDTAPAPVLATLELEFAFESDLAVRGARLALENASRTQITLNGRRIQGRASGWWVDESIQTIALPPLRRGGNKLVLSIPFTRTTDVEWCYLLGDFGVAVAGRNARILRPARTICWGDWTHQGLPFYAGNVTYRCRIAGEGPTMIVAPKFRNPLLSVDLDGKPAGKIAFAPHQLVLDLHGKHELAITAFGNRANAFGPLHHTNENLTWVGPAAWRSEGVNWSYEYNFKRMGVLSAPVVRRFDTD